MMHLIKCMYTVRMANVSNLHDICTVDLVNMLSAVTLFLLYSLFTCTSLENICIYGMSIFKYMGNSTEKSTSV